MKDWEKFLIIITVIVFCLWLYGSLVYGGQIEFTPMQFYIMNQ